MLSCNSQSQSQTNTHQPVQPPRSPQDASNDLLTDPEYQQREYEASGNHKEAVRKLSQTLSRLKLSTSQPQQYLTLLAPNHADIQGPPTTASFSFITTAAYPHNARLSRSERIDNWLNGLSEPEATIPRQSTLWVPPGQPTVNSHRQQQLERCVVRDLRQLCRDYGIEILRNPRKADFVRLILQYEGVSYFQLPQGGWMKRESGLEG